MVCLPPPPPPPPPLFPLPPSRKGSRNALPGGGWPDDGLGSAGGILDHVPSLFRDSCLAALGVPLRWRAAHDEGRLPSLPAFVFSPPNARPRSLEVHKPLSRPSRVADNRFWTMWKLPMFGVTDPEQVLREIDDCRAQFPTAYIRLVAFDDLRQVQITSELLAFLGRRGLGLPQQLGGSRVRLEGCAYYLVK
jgi:hypothetical protein